MKATIQTTQLTEINLPKFFKVKDRDNLYFMTTGEESVVEVKDYEFNEPLLFHPSISLWAVRHINHLISKGIIPISETEFKSAFIKVSLEIEKLMN